MAAGRGASGAAPQKRVTIEDLLHFKRAEQPPADFWRQFENELRAKQLAAIVGKRPWWASLSRGMACVARHPLPVGAAAALAVAVAGFRGYHAVTSIRVRSHDGPVLAVSAVFERNGPVARQAPGTPPPVAGGGPRAFPAPARREPAAMMASYRGPVSESEASPPTLDTPYAGAHSGTGRVDTPSARSIAANLADVQASEPEVIRNLLGLSRSLDGRLASAPRPRPEPLEQMPTPSSERRSRLLAQALPAVASSTAYMAAPISERFVSNLSDDSRFRQSVSRYGMGEDNLSIRVKF